VSRGARRATAFSSVALLALAALATAEPESTNPGRVAPNAESIEPIAAGNPVPSATVRTIDGEPLDLASLTRDKGALLVFYRGGW
jgi:hypothetical protein